MKDDGILSQNHIFLYQTPIQTPYPFFERNIRIIVIYSLNIKIFKISTIINHQQK